MDGLLSRYLSQVQCKLLLYCYVSNVSNKIVQKIVGSEDTVIMENSLFLLYYRSIVQYAYIVSTVSTLIIAMSVNKC